MPTPIPCQVLATDGAVPLWECPCRACTRMEWQTLTEPRPLLRDWRATEWPEHWGDR